MLKRALRVSKRPIRKLRKWVLVGPPILFFIPASRQRWNRRSQEKRNLRSWHYSNAYRNLAPDGACIFLHIPKTAGTFLARNLVEKAAFEWLDPRTPPRGNKIIIPHFSIDWLIENDILSKQFVSNTPVFTVVREPVDRTYSAFKYLKRMGAVPPRWAFITFLRYLIQERPEIGGAQVSRLSHAAPQSLWIDQSMWPGPQVIFDIQQLSNAGKWLAKNGFTPKDLELQYLPRQSPYPNESELRLIKKFAAADFELFENRGLTMRTLD